MANWLIGQWQRSGVVLKWWSVLDAHKTRAARDGSTGVALCCMVTMFAHSGSGWGKQGGRGAWRVCECVGTRRTTDSKRGLECVEWWRIAWRLSLLLAQCLVCGALWCGVVCGTGWCQNDECVNTAGDHARKSCTRMKRDTAGHEGELFAVDWRRGVMCFVGERNSGV